MFTSLDCLKIEPNDYVKKYSENFISLIKQKDKDRSGKIDEIMEKIKSENIFTIDGDDKFKKETYDNIKELLQVKPGRVLIKELIKLVLFNRNIKDTDDFIIMTNTICIKSGQKDFRHDDGPIEINLDKQLKTYNAIHRSKMVTSSRQNSIILAHELIHELHYRKKNQQRMAQEYARSKRLQKNPDLDLFKNIKCLPEPKFKDCSIEGCEDALKFRKLDNLEEQHTILGVNIPDFIKNQNTLDKSDILSENAFLCAFNLLPRIDHQEAAHDSIGINTPLDQESLSSYYDWLIAQITERNERIAKEFASYM